MDEPQVVEQNERARKPQNDDDDAVQKQQVVEQEQEATGSRIVMPRTMHTPRVVKQGQRGMVPQSKLSNRTSGSPGDDGGRHGA